MKTDKKNLYHLSELSDYKIASGYPDIRGWDVKDRDNRVIGKVDNLLVNKNMDRVLYIDVEVDSTIIEANHDPYKSNANPEVREFINKDGDNHIIVPIGLVDINEENNYVYTESVDYNTFAETKRYNQKASIDRDYEIIILDSYLRKNEVDEDRRRVESSEAGRRISIDDETSEWDSEWDSEREWENQRKWEEEDYIDDDYKDEDYIDDDPFYKRREFDDSRFRKWKK